MSLPVPGELIGSYRVVREIARGGMGAVYLAKKRAWADIEMDVALKMPLPRWAAETSYLHRFLDEARISAAVHHPNVVRVYDVGFHRGSLPFLVMEYVPGLSLGSLARHVAEQGWVLPPGMVLWMLAEAAEGLHGAHRTRAADGDTSGIVHRDAGPHNVLVGEEGQIKLVDFGIARARDRLSMTAAGQVPGTLRYISPERILLQPTDHRADVWAIAVTAWELLTGRPLFRAASRPRTIHNILNAAIPSLRHVVAEPVSDVLTACLQREPRDRLASCQTIAHTFRAAAQQLGWWSPSHVAAQVAALLGHAPVSTSVTAAGWNDVPAMVPSQTRPVSSLTELSEPASLCTWAGVGPSTLRDPSGASSPRSAESDAPRSRVSGPGDDAEWPAESQPLQLVRRKRCMDGG